MSPVWSRFLGAGSPFRPALFISVGAWNPVITVITAITVITTPVPSKVVAERTQRISIRSPPARIPADRVACSALSPFRRLLPGLGEFFDVPPEWRSHRRHPTKLLLQKVLALRT